MPSHGARRKSATAECADRHWLNQKSGRYAATLPRRATEEIAGQIGMGSLEDVDRAVGAARRAFSIWSEGAWKSVIFFDIQRFQRAATERQSAGGQGGRGLRRLVL